MAAITTSPTLISAYPKLLVAHFKEHTWVNLDYLSEFDNHELTNLVERLLNIQRLGSIPIDILKAIMDC